MKKIFLFIITILLFNISITLSEIQDCNEFDKLSKEYLKCQKDNLLYKSEESGLTENVTPSWESAKFVGNPFNYYTYSGIERSVSFNFTVFPMNLRELINNWNKIEYLTSLCYPLSYVGTPGYVQAPFLFLTLGDMYAKKPSFIESLTYTVPDNGTWEIGVDAEEEGEAGDFFKKSGFVGSNNPPSKSKGYRLPHFIEVAVTFKFVEHRGNSGKTNLYSFKSLT